MMEASGNNVALVMSYSGHKSLESFKIYLNAPTQGCTATDQRIESVGLFVASFAGRNRAIEGRSLTLAVKTRVSACGDQN
jgi:hypothetical protein